MDHTNKSSKDDFRIEKVLFNNDEQFQNSIKKIISTAPKKFVSLLKKFAVTWDELYEFLPDFIDLKNSINDVNKFPYTIELSRVNGKLCFDKKPVKNKLTDILNLQKHLWLSDISPFDSKSKLNKIIIKNNEQSQMENRVKCLLEAFKTNDVYALSKGIFAYSNNSITNSKLAQAISLEFAESEINTVYFKTQSLFTYLKSSFSSKYNDAKDISQILSNVDVLVIDGLGSETANSWFLFDYLSNIIANRIINNKLNIIFSTLDIDALQKYYTSHKTLKDDIHKATILVNNIKTSSFIYNF
ncbi:hypothetical protein E1I18_02290 [Mycoplasmopsis mucosicanis]|uniref:ATP-binding protein n=1 Tax=Mycoplasmopsis mucosicanis TaxID=458208 RepID=A0A507SJS8_9BACT|nr:hypothetical protein [Mycoplasmopsis mucosicanis]TQC51491.1 hypothetical protein E1I18_02290 [Mycoplasmopsis mucosicanis]